MGVRTGSIPELGKGSYKFQEKWGASSPMKALKEGVGGHLGPQDLDSGLAINKVRTWNLTSTPGFPVSRERVIALFTYIILPTPLPPQIFDCWNRTGWVNGSQGTGWTLAYRFRKIPFCWTSESLVKSISLSEASYLLVHLFLTVLVIHRYSADWFRLPWGKYYSSESNDSPSKGLQVENENRRWISNEGNMEFHLHT